MKLILPIIGHLGALAQLLSSFRRQLQVQFLLDAWCPLTQTPKPKQFQPRHIYRAIRLSVAHASTRGRQTLAFQTLPPSVPLYCT